MKSSTFLAVTAIITMVYGVALFLVPTQFFSIYGFSLDAPGLFIARYFGSALIGVAALNWLVRNQATREIFTGDFVLAATGFVIALLQALSGTANALTWTTVLVYLVFGLGFGYFAFMNQETTRLAKSG